MGGGLKKEIFLKKAEMEFVKVFFFLGGGGGG